MNPIIVLARYLIASVLPLLLLGCMEVPTSGTGPSGTVLDSLTGRPIKDAHVVVEWSEYFSGVEHSSTACYWVQAATTDENGRFSVGTWKMDPARALNPAFKHGSLTTTPIGIKVYAPGHEVSFNLYPIQGSDLAIRVGPASNSPAGRINELRLSARFSCKWVLPSDAPTLIPVYDTLLRELQSLSESPPGESGLEDFILWTKANRACYNNPPEFPDWQRPCAKDEFDKFGSTKGPL